ncbi:MAG: hypothetical protein BZ136_01095 [Methanosphaera sp. rholeuAM74]|nr:MAG: hypothetical protein BZ136_01095 [Methanosphaera sp. rholeuAM74]
MMNIFRVMKDKLHLMALMLLFLVVEVYCDLSLPSYTADIVDMGIRNADFNVIYSVGLSMVGMVAISTVATVVVAYFSSIVSSRYARDLREVVFKRILGFSNHELNRFSRASLITRSTNDINQIQNVMGMLFRTLLFAPIIALGGIIKVLEIGSDLSWIIVLAFVSVSVLLVFVIRNVLPAFRRTQIIVDYINRVSREILLGVPVIKAFVRQDYENQRFDRFNVEYRDVNLRVYRILFLMIPAMTLIMNLMIVLILYFGLFDVLDGRLLTGDVIAFVQYSTQIVTSFIMIGSLTIMLPRVLISARRVEEVLSTEGSIIGGVHASCEGDAILEFRNVSYRYPNALRDTLHDVTFSLCPGRVTAIIGGTGSGKSTILSLIPRLQDVTSGVILLDGRNIRDYDLNYLRSKTAIVPQDAVLFSGTVADNLRRGKSDASDDELLGALKVADACDFVGSLDMDVSQGGANFSGGQKQRLSIARAVVGGHDFYLFDDCFSALDVATESLVKSNLVDVTSNASVLMVSQRVSSIMDADEIIVLDDGRIVDKGTHDELLGRCSIYGEIFSSQMGSMGGRDA